MRTIATLLLALLAFVSTSGQAAAAPAPSARILFLRGGDVWSADLKGQGARAVTKTGGKVDGFEVSPDGRYLAYAKVVGYRDEPGIWDEEDAGDEKKTGKTPAAEPPGRAVTSVVVADLASGRTLREIPPPDDEWLHVGQFGTGGRLFLYTTGGFDVTGFVEIDVVRGTRRDLDDVEGRAFARQADWAADGSVLAYIDQSSALHLVDLATGVDRMLPARRGAVDLAISPDRSRIAYVDVEWTDARKRDRLWLYDVKAQTTTGLYSGPVTARSGRGVAWSPDGRRIAMLWQGAVVVDVRDPSAVRQVKATEAAWLDATTLLVGDGKDLYAHRLDTGSRELLVKDARQGRVVRR